MTGRQTWLDEDRYIDEDGLLRGAKAELADTVTLGADETWVTITASGSGTRKLRLKASSDGDLVFQVTDTGTGSFADALRFNLDTGAVEISDALVVNGNAALSSGSVLSIGGTTVLSGQMAAVTNPSGGATVDAECRAQLAALIDALQGVGLMGS